MNLQERTIDGSAYLYAIHTVAHKKFELYFGTKDSEIEFALNDHSLEYRGTRLPYENYVSGLVQSAIDLGAELLLVKKGD